ncbi:MAG TPA: ABC transporter substrate-binding protein [Chloroflexota bacterium]|jgi:4,5-dihydroxyphthalate decarboxylase
MANTKLRFRFREPTVDTNQPLSDGTVKIEGYDLEVLTDPRADCDVWDAGFGELVQAYAKDAPYVSIPAFPNRKFRLSYIFINTSAGIKEPKDLEGKRVGIMGWGNTAGVWARGALQNYYEVDLHKIRWLTTLPGPSDPAGIHIDDLPKGSNLDALLVSGELDAVIQPDVLDSVARRDPRTRRLFTDWKTEEQTYYKQTGVFPISHSVTFRQEYVAQHPDAPVALLKAYRQARDVAFDMVEGGNPHTLVISWASAAMAEQRALMGENYWPYNVADNARVLEALTQFALQQGLTQGKKLNYETFFHPEAAALPGF